MQETRLDRRHRLRDARASREQRALLAWMVAGDADEPPLTSDEIQPMLTRLVAFETREELTALDGEMAQAGKERDRVLRRLNNNPRPHTATKLQRLEDKLATLQKRYSALYVQLLLASAASDPQELALVKGYLDGAR